MSVAVTECDFYKRMYLHVDLWVNRTSFWIDSNFFCTYVALARFLIVVSAVAAYDRALICIEVVTVHRAFLGFQWGDARTPCNFKAAV